jgi:hypothetical protein
MIGATVADQSCRHALNSGAKSHPKRREDDSCNKNQGSTRMYGSVPGTRANEAPGPSLPTPRTSTRRCSLERDYDEARCLAQEY